MYNETVDVMWKDFHICTLTLREVMQNRHISTVEQYETVDVMWNLHSGSVDVMWNLHISTVELWM